MIEVPANEIVSLLQLVPHGHGGLPVGWKKSTDATLLLEAQAKGYYPAYKRGHAGEGFIAQFLQRHTHIRVRAWLELLACLICRIWDSEVPSGITLWVEVSDSGESVLCDLTQAYTALS